MLFQTIDPYKDIRSQILDQIQQAFQTTPNIASTLHGQRKIYQGCYSRRTSLFPSQKCGGAIPLESRLELAHAICLERDSKVSNYRTQALKIYLHQNQFIYPDFLIQTEDSLYEVHEVKPLITSLSLEALNRYTRLGNLLNSIDVTFLLIDQKELPSDIEIAQLLYWYQRGHRFNWTSFEIDYALSQLQQTEYANPKQVYDVLTAIGFKQELGDYLFFHKKVKLSSMAMQGSLLL